MDILRLVLFSGLVFHKVVWEVMKIRDRVPQAMPSHATSLSKRLVKYLKTAVLVFLLVQTLFLDLFPIFDQPTVLRIIGGALFFLGLAVAITGRVQLGKSWANLEDFQVLPNQSVVRTGIYRYIRHPIYTGDVFLLVGLELALNSWLVLAVFVPLVVIWKQAAAEEALLSQVFEDYEDYRKQTKGFIPFLI